MAQDWGIRAIGTHAVDPRQMNGQRVIDRDSARQLVLKHGFAEALRTLDALQLAVALNLRRSGFEMVLVAAGQKLCRVAALAGFRVVNPEESPILI